jgi:hypothetical protein
MPYYHAGGGVIRIWGKLDTGQPVLIGARRWDDGDPLLTKKEYVQSNPRSIDHCWCCGGDWDTCICDFFPGEGNLCKDCGRCDPHCACVKVGGNIFKVGARVASGEITVEQAAEQLQDASCGKKAYWKMHWVTRIPQDPRPGYRKSHIFNVPEPYRRLEP